MNVSISPQIGSNGGKSSNDKFVHYAVLKKCGEITVSADKLFFGLNCAFCNGTCLQLEIFIQHLLEKHSKDIENLYTSSGQEPFTHTLLEFNNKTDLKIAETLNNIENETNWSETIATTTTTTTTATTNTMTTLATLLSEVNFDLETGAIRPEAAELQELVFIMEDNSDSILNMVEEETVEPFQLRSNAVGESTLTIQTKKTQNKIDNGIEVKKTEKENEAQNIFSLNAPHQFKSIKGEEDPSTMEYAQNLRKTIHPIMMSTMEDGTSAITTRRAGHNREVITYLLRAYEQNAKLWDPNHPMYKYNAPRSVFNELSEPLKRDMNVALSGVEIFQIIIGLRSRYRRELTRMKPNDQVKKSKLWYFEKMHFLRDIIENKRVDRELRKRLQPTETAEKLCKTGKSQTPKEALLFLLESYKDHEMLWNPVHKDFENCDDQQIYANISKKLLVEKSIKITPSLCKSELEKLVSRYRKEFNDVNRRKGLHIPKLWCFDELDFLKPVFENEFSERSVRKKGIISRTSRSRTRAARINKITFKNDDDQLKFIGIYKAYPALWSCEHPDYRSIKYRDEAMQQMLRDFTATFNVDVSIERLEKTILVLRKSFSTMKQKEISENSENNSVGSPVSITSTSTTNSTTIKNFISSKVYGNLVEFLDANIGPFRCDICEIVIRTPDQYKIHKSGHDGTMPFMCVICGKGFQVPGNLAIHIRRHKRDFPYSCEQCKKAFATSTEVAIHQRVHTGVRPYICDLCGKTFKTWSFFDIHRRVHLNQSAFLCPICDKGFYEKNRYTAHMNGHLNIRKHCCKVCDKSFTTLANLKKHHELHLPVRKYKCDVCNLRFAQLASLRWHKRKTHLNAVSMEQ